MGFKRRMSMFRVAGICPKCMCGEFEKEDGMFICSDCNREYGLDELELIDYQE